MNRGDPLAGSLPPVSKESFWACGRAGGRRRAEAIGSLDRQGLTARSGDAISGDQLRASARWAGGRREVKGRSRLAGAPGRVSKRPFDCRYSGLRSGHCGGSPFGQACAREVACAVACVDIGAG